MRSKLLFLIVLIVALAAFCGTVSANLQPNPSMEDPCDGPPDGWWDWGSNYTWGGSVQEFLKDSAEARTGDWYAHAQSDAAGYANILAPNVPVEEGKTYYAGMYVKDIQPGGSSNGVGIECLYWTAAGRDDTYKHVEMLPDIPDDGQYHLITSQSIPIPVGVVEMVIGFNAQGGSDYHIDDFYLDTTRPAGGGSGVHSPNPAHGSTFIPPTDSFPSPITLKWTKQGGQQGDELIIDEVWWNAGSADCNENNFEAEKDPTPLPHTDPNTALATINAEKNYYWRVDVIDPNGGNYGVDTLIGPIWHFTTVNSKPTVDAGIKQAMWQDGVPNPVEFKLDATVSDDGLPVPAGLTYSWTKISGAGAVTFNPSSAVEDPCAVISVVDDYVLQLSVNDGSGPVTDTVKLRVHANGTTGLEARYDVEEGNAAAGIHDDYSGYERNPGGGDGLGPPSRRGERMDDIDTPGMTGTTIDLTGGHNAQPEQNAGDLTKGGIVFDGGAGYVQASNSQGEPNENAPGGAVRTWADFENEVSVAAWVKIEEGNFDKPWQSIICNGNTSYRLQQNGDSDTVLFNLSLTNDQGDSYTAGAWGSIEIDDGQWHHVMGTYDGTKVALYIDGLEDTSTATEGTINIGNDWLTYGHNLGYLTPNGDEDEDGIRDGDDTVVDTVFNGVMDEIRIHSIGLPWRSDNPGNPESGTPDMTTARSVVSIYRASDGHENCGGNYLPGDVDESCYVDLADVKLMAEEWLDCSSIDRERCDGYWK